MKLDRIAPWVIGMTFLVPVAVNAQVQSRNEISLDGGGAISNGGLLLGGLIEVQYARSITDSLWLVVRPEFLLYLDGSHELVTLGLDVGLRWLLGSRDRIHLGFGAGMGGLFFIGPGFGVGIRTDGRVYLPVGASISFILGGAVELGVAVLGSGGEDSYRRMFYQIRGDLFAGLAFLF